MKLRIIHFGQLLLILLLLICFQNEAFSQKSDTSRVDNTGIFVGLSGGPSQSLILNSGTLSVSDLISIKKNAFFGFVEIGYFFSKYFGLSSGIGYISYKTQLTLDTYQSKFNTTDTENESYEQRVSGSEIKEIQDIGLISVPISINIRLPINKNSGFFLQPGINLLMPLTKNYYSSGTFTYQGYYPAYNVLFENLPAHGFPSNLSSKAEGNLELNPLGVNAIVAAGFDFFVQKNFQIAIAACYDRSLINISGYTSPDKFQLSSEANQINSLMGGSSNAMVKSMGLNIYFRYYLK